MTPLTANNCSNGAGPTWLPINYASPVLHHVLVEGDQKTGGMHHVLTFIDTIHGRLKPSQTLPNPPWNPFIPPGLVPGTTYFYKVGDPRYYYGYSGIMNFTTLGVAPGTAPTYPFR